MTDILILTHVDYCAPGHLATVLEQHGLDFTVLRTDLNQLDGYDLDRPRAVAVMGGPMSVNDDLPWIRAEIDALRHFIRRIRGRAALHQEGLDPGGVIVKKFGKGLPVLPRANGV